MRPGQNKRMRGRNNNNNNSNRRGPNPLTRSYESNGPDVKIRGTAHHVGEKYLQLARDAQSSGDPVMAESYLQHAEHYFRLIASAQLAQQQAQFGYQRQPGEQVEQDDDGDDDFESLPDRFASPSEKVAPTPAPQPQPQPQPQAQPYEPRNDRSYNDRQPYEARNNGQAQNGHYADRPQQNDRGNDNRPRQPYADRQDRNAQQQDRGGQQDRNGQDRGNGDRNFQDRGGQDRSGQDRGGQDRGGQGQDRGNANGGERQNRDYDNRNFRTRRDERSREGQPVRDVQPRPPVPDEQPVVGLPAFITAPTRVPVADAAEVEQPVIAQAEAPAVAPETSEDPGFHMRPRRRRRPKPELAGVDGATEGAAVPAPGGEGSDS